MILGSHGYRLEDHTLKTLRGRCRIGGRGDGTSHSQFSARVLRRVAFNSRLCAAVEPSQGQGGGARAGEAGEPPYPLSEKVSRWAAPKLNSWRSQATAIRPGCWETRHHGGGFAARSEYLKSKRAQHPGVGKRPSGATRFPLLPSPSPSPFPSPRAPRGAKSLVLKVSPTLRSAPLALWLARPAVGCGRAGSRAPGGREGRDAVQCCSLPCQYCTRPGLRPPRPPGLPLTRARQPPRGLPHPRLPGSLADLRRSVAAATVSKWGWENFGDPPSRHPILHSALSGVFSTLA